MGEFWDISYPIENIAIIEFCLEYCISHLKLILKFHPLVAEVICK